MYHTRTKEIEILKRENIRFRLIEFVIVYQKGVKLNNIRLLSLLNYMLYNIIDS